MLRCVEMIGFRPLLKVGGRGAGMVGGGGGISWGGGWHGWDQRWPQGPRRPPAAAIERGPHRQALGAGGGHGWGPSPTVVRGPQKQGHLNTLALLDSALFWVSHNFGIARFFGEKNPTQHPNNTPTQHPHWMGVRPPPPILISNPDLSLPSGPGGRGVGE